MKYRAALALLVLGFWASGQVGRADPIDFTFTTFDIPGAISIEPAAINDAGQIVGSYMTSANSIFHGFLYDGSAFTTIDVPPLQPGLPAGGTMLSGINNAGQIVGTLFETSPFQNPHAFELDSRGVTFLDLSGHDGVAYSINNKGQIVGYFYDDIGIHGFLDTNGAITTIDIPGLSITRARAINDLGQIVLNGDTYNGFLDTNGVFSEIHFPGARDTYLSCINDAGQIVGLSSGVLDPVGGFTPIVVPGAQTTIPSGINNVGQIVGRFIDSSGSAHGFVATPVPEAASALLTISGLLVAVFANRKRERLNAILSGAAHISSCHPHRKAGA
jgi:uncharacterized membrane protein